MKILVSGSTGLVGTALVQALKKNGHEIIRLVRHGGHFDEPLIQWDIAKKQLNPADLKDVDAVIHLAGENIASGLWTEEKKQKIAESRIQGTRLLAETLAAMENPPKTFICASAIGYYGSRGDELLTEVSSLGQGFLADTCRQWEAATQPASEKGIRVVHTRFAMILSPKGGALKMMYWPFKLGLAGNLGNGKQYMSWITLEDVIGALLHLLNHPDIRGPVNVASPQPVTNAEFTKTMHQTVTCALSPGRIWAPPAPALALKLLLGELGSELFLGSQRVQPVRLLESGYVFQHANLRQALQSIV